MYREVQSEMVKFPYVTSAQQTVKEAQNYMLECGIRHLPVMEGTSLVGVVSERMLLKESKTPEKTVGEFMIQKPFVVKHDENLAHVVRLMVDNKWGCALVVNSDQALIGIFTTIDAQKLLLRFLEGDNKFYNSYENIIPMKDVVDWI